jgi:hypothetical protein
MGRNGASYVTQPTLAARSIVTGAEGPLEVFCGSALQNLEQNARGRADPGLPE